MDFELTRMVSDHGHVRSDGGIDTLNPPPIDRPLRAYMSSRIPMEACCSQKAFAWICQFGPPLERERLTDERLSLLPDIVGFLGGELVFRPVVSVGIVLFVCVDSIRKGDIARPRGSHNHGSALLYGIAQVRTEAVVPRPPERQLVREGFEAKLAAKRRIRSQVIMERCFVPAVDRLFGRMKTLVIHRH